MRLSKGWTLIELTLVVLVISVIGAVAMRSVVSNRSFDEYFQMQHLCNEFLKARALVFYSRTPIQVTLDHHQLTFKPDSKTMPFWTLSLPKSVLIPKEAFPMRLSTDNLNTDEPDIKILSKQYALNIDPKTGFAYFESIHG